MVDADEQLATLGSVHDKRLDVLLIKATWVSFWYVVVERCGEVEKMINGDGGVSLRELREKSRQDNATQVGQVWSKVFVC